ncbi:hypothetical protein EXM22_09990 [Oceanispirochaeta crateris]|uniref:Beta-glucosidase n=1 Tax=Oceanispirochaeta crateris TaxID=2518645 RepID=A0A5C1QJH9_9SPIO|nr:GH116 family glycosyl-hydrolase [Oceanispirochaeta crateris]QEN08303.1 hypothetical protein EXM22_09990 [Oceanispirochaeta crateris]
MRKNFEYTNEHQTSISFPLGGIGSGCIGLAGNGHLQDWEIFNRPAKGQYNEFSHFSIKVEDETRVLDARVLNGDLNPPFTGPLGTEKTLEGFGFGPRRETLAGLPHFESNTFKGTFPIAELSFSDMKFPGKVVMEAFNPLIPHEEDDSSIPAAFFSFTITNTQDKTLYYYLNGILGNPYKGKTRNTFSKKSGISKIMLDSLDQNKDDISSGDLCIATDSEDVSFQEYLYRGEWFDALEVYWKDMTSFGPFKKRSYAPEDLNIRDNALLSSRIKLAAGESKTIRYTISWSHPVNKNTWGRMKSGRTTPYTEEEKYWLGKSWLNYYAVLWSNSTDSAEYSLLNWNRLYRSTVAFRNALFASSLPESVLDAVTSNVSILKSPTVWRLEDGTFYGWEGSGENEGSCEGTCSHVWGYAQVLPFLFPKLSRSVRQAEYEYNWADDGSLTFRLMLPIGSPRWHFRPAVDGQFATIMKTYREWKICGDFSWLKKLWPKVKKALEFAWASENLDQWDPGKTGILTGMQHHTLDMELFGPNAWLSGMYLGALKACSEMARAMDDLDSAKEYEEILEKGCRILNRDLFNGEYFIQKIDLKNKKLLEPFVDKGLFNFDNNDGTIYDIYWSEEHKELKYQIAEGVSIDQLLGQWHSDIYGLGDIFEISQTQKALRSLMKYNFRENMREHYNPCRLFCLNDESGLVICSWPENKERPTIPVPYSQETMHGFEYAAADLMIRRGLIEEGLKVVKSVRDRYDGFRRNPWNEMECGSNYARSMASYSLLLTFSGFTFDGRIKHIGFKPIFDGPSSFFWSFNTAWGSFTIENEKSSFVILGGNLELKSFGLPKNSSVRTIRKNEIEINFKLKKSQILFEDIISIRVGDSLDFIS